MAGDDGEARVGADVCGLTAAPIRNHKPC